MTAHAKTHDYATKNWPCPLARTFADTQANAHCRGDLCPVWRYQSTQVFADAVSAVANEIKEDKSPISARPKASAIVAADPRKYGLEGICGLGGGR